VLFKKFLFQEQSIWGEDM